MAWASLLAGVCAPSLAAQTPAPATQAPTPAKAHFFEVLPVIFTGPATGPAIGLSSLWLRPSPDSLTRPSQVSAIAYVTSKKQLDLVTTAEFWSRGNVNRFTIQGETSYYPTPFFGVGPLDPTFAQRNYTLTLFTISARFQHRIAPHLYAGVGAGTRHAGIDNLDSTLATEADTIPGMAGSGTFWIEENLELDTRDNVLNPGRGGIVWVRLLQAPKILGTSFSYLDAQVDVRHYVRLGHAGILAAQASWETLRGTAPFDLLPNFGGPNDLRGYVNNRWRAHNALIAQLEWRQPLFGRLGYAAFVGAGSVFDRASEFRWDQVRPSYGVGLRYLIVPSQRANIRIDLGFGQDSHAIYAGFGEAF